MNRDEGRKRALVLFGDLEQVGQRRPERGGPSHFTELDR